MRKYCSMTRGLEGIPVFSVCHAKCTGAVQTTQRKHEKYSDVFGIFTSCD